MIDCIRFVCVWVTAFARVHGTLLRTWRAQTACPVAFSFITMTSVELAGSALEREYAIRGAWGTQRQRERE